MIHGSGIRCWRCSAAVSENFTFPATAAADPILPALQPSTDGLHTTPTGSLPLPADLIRMMFAKEEGVPVEPTALQSRIRDAVAETVKKQVEAGVTVVNDGEMSKPSYATYVKDRLSGFGGASHPLQYRDLVDF